VENKRAELKVKKRDGQKSYMPSYFQNVGDKHNHDILRYGNISVLVQGGKLIVWKRVDSWCLRTTLAVSHSKIVITFSDSSLATP